ncbi:MAG: hypothetical protein WD669_01900 [Pirellulales bacterium]
MIGKRSLGVSETRLGLSLLTGLLVVLGYVALQRLGGMGDAPPIEVRSGKMSGPAGGGIGNRSDPGDLQVLPTQEPDPNHVPRTSLRPTWLPAPKLDLRDEIERSDIDSLWPMPPATNEDRANTSGGTRR